MPLAFSNDNGSKQDSQSAYFKEDFGMSRGLEEGGNIRRKRCLSLYNVKWRRGSVVFVMMMSSMRGAAENPPNGNNHSTAL